jgi:hypothetical protein
MSALDRSEIWHHLVRALTQLAPLADNRAIPAADRSRALEHLDLVSQAANNLRERSGLTRYEARLIDSEIARLRGRFQQPAPPPANRPGQPPLPPAGAQAAFDRINKLQSALSHMAETGECHREVLQCVRRGLESDLAILSNPQQLATLPQDTRQRAQVLVRDTQRHLQTISVQQEIQAAVDAPKVR